MMLMPEASMDEYELMEPGKYQIGPTRQAGRMQSKAKAQPMGKAADAPLRCSIAASDTRHEGRTFRRRHVIHSR